MARLLGYMANRRDRLQDVLHQERAVIDAPPRDRPAGWGIGFYQSGEVLHKKRPLPQGQRLDWASVAKDVRSDCVVAHLRQPTVGDFRAENMHPFRMRSWLFAHNGTVERFEAMRPRMLESMPDFLRRNIRGKTDSEPFFHLILSFLHDAGQLDNPDVDEGTVVHAVRSSVALVDRLCAEVGAPPATLNMVLTNGNRMFALRRGSPMMYVERRGVHDPVNPSAVEISDPSALRYVLVVSDGPETPAGFVELSDGAVVVIDRNLHVSVNEG